MKSILEEFARGNISPDLHFLKSNSEYEKAVDALCEAEKKLRSVLNEGGQELLAAYMDAQGAVNQRANIDRFVYGFKLGALMMLEVLGGGDI